MVNFAVPFDGGSPITDYKVLASTGGTFTVARTAPAICTTSDKPQLTASCEVVGLTNGTGYSFKVEGVNAIGVGSPSSKTIFIAPATVPWAPRNVTVTPGNESASVHWTPPLHDGGAIVSFYIVRAYTGGSTHSCDSTGTACVIRGLTNGRRYAVRVFARNWAGLSASSAPESVVPQR
jgi:hypothetical protein